MGPTTYVYIVNVALSLHRPFGFPFLITGTKIGGGGFPCTLCWYFMVKHSCFHISIALADTPGRDLKTNLHFKK